MFSTNFSYLVEFSLKRERVKCNPRPLPADTALSAMPQCPVLSESEDEGIDISDVQDVLDPLSKVEAGLQGTKKEKISLESVSVRAKLMDLAAQVQIMNVENILGRVRTSMPIFLVLLVFTGRDFAALQKQQQ